MSAESPSTSVPHREIETRLTPQSLATNAWPALLALGYSLREETRPNEASALNSNVWLVDQARLDEMPASATAPNAQILLISSPGRSQPEDPRIIGRTLRPGRLSSVYAMLQLALESTPRKAPRVPTRLSARCLRADRHSTGALLSLSEGGCLMRSGEKLRKGAKLDLQFALPNFGLVSTVAECRYVRRTDAGLEFITPPPDIRNSIAQYVTMQLIDPSGESSANPS